MQIDLLFKIAILFAILMNIFAIFSKNNLRVKLYSHIAEALAFLIVTIALIIQLCLVYQNYLSSGSLNVLQMKIFNQNFWQLGPSIILSAIITIYTFWKAYDLDVKISKKPKMQI